jgi:hypothetical protein
MPTNPVAVISTEQPITGLDAARTFGEFAAAFKGLPSSKLLEYRLAITPATASSEERPLLCETPQTTNQEERLKKPAKWEAAHRVKAAGESKPWLCVVPAEKTLDDELIELIEQEAQEERDFLEAVDACNEDLVQKLINQKPADERAYYVELMYERIEELQAEKIAKTNAEHQWLNNVSEKEADAYYDRHFQGTDVFNVDYGSPISNRLLDKLLEDGLLPCDIAELKAIDAATATPEQLLDHARLFDMDMDHETPGLLGWVDRQARKRLVEIQQAIAAAERINATQPII